jgi:putative cell wall-binding protein
MKTSLYRNFTKTLLWIKSNDTKKSKIQFTLTNLASEKLQEVVLLLSLELSTGFVMYSQILVMQNICDFIPAISVSTQINEPVLHVTDIDIKK